MEHTSIVIVAFDGLQPAQVTPELTPHLARLAAEGVTCQNHHAVFPTVTRANVASIVTGHPPGSHGLTANTLVVPENDPYLPFSALEPTLTELATKHPVLLQPTLGDILSRHGMQFMAVGSGTSGNAYLQNPNAESNGGATIHPEFTLPRALHGELESAFGGWPDRSAHGSRKLEHAANLFIEYVLKARRPDAATLWLNEPDSSQHAHGVGSPAALELLAAADSQLGRILNWLEEEGLSAETNVLVISDHGYSTISEVIDVEAAIRAAGFPPGSADGGVTVAANGGSVLFYVSGNNNRTTQGLASFLMGQPWCGALLFAEGAGEVPGALPASLVGLDGPRAPSLTMSFRWNSRANDAGYAGHAYASNLSPGKGQHGSMSPHETRNVLFARGPSFKQSTVITSPTGNADVAPTILNLLGLPGGEQMSGRVLEEALAGGPQEMPWHTVRHHSYQSESGDGYCQSIKLSFVGSAKYVDEGAVRSAEDG